jgi:uncharacterized protein
LPVAETNWGAVAYVVAVTVVGAFAALWAQGSPVNRGMRSALYVTLGFIGSLLFLVGVLALVAPFISPWGPMVAGLAISLPLWRPFRQAVARVIPIDPASATHMVALIAVLVALLISAASIVSVAMGWVAPEPPPSPVESVVQYLAAGVLAFFAVGLGLRRTWPAALQRLGLTAPTPLQVAVALGLGLAAAVGQRALQALLPLAPEQADRLTGLLAALLDAPAAALAVAVATAVGLETLFRGALQPRLGLVLTTITYTALNTGYPAPAALITLVVFSVAMGLLRQRASTTACIIAHLSYNCGLLALLALAAGRL